MNNCEHELTSNYLEDGDGILKVKILDEFFPFG